jgi:hypothetical protein
VPSSGKETEKIIAENLIKIGSSHPEILKAEPDLKTALLRKTTDSFVKDGRVNLIF